MESIVNGYFVPTVGFEEDMVVLVLVDSQGFRVDRALRHLLLSWLLLIRL